ncbi:MAG: tyrosine-type recombinase/integrase [Rubrivivax sp.]
MTTDRKHLPPRVFPKGKWYYLVRAEGKKRVWDKLTRISEGVPALYRKLAELASAEIRDDRMPALVVAWARDVGSTHSEKTRKNDDYLTAEIAQRFAEFRAADVTPRDVKEFLVAYRDRPRTHNAYRSMVRELMRYAEEQGYRDAGTNPVDSIRTMPIKPRDRYITDSELRRIKVAAMYGDDDKRTRSGAMTCALIDLAYLTGQRISDLLELRWSKRVATNAKGEVEAPYIEEAQGIYFQPAKTARTTGAKVLIAWTPRLREVIERIRAMKRQNMRYIVTTQDSQPYTYSGASTAWKRAVRRAGVANVHFHDLRAKALTDKESREGMQAARTMGAHSTEQQTADYVRQKQARKTSATR